MSSLELLPDLTITLYKKLRRSMTSHSKSKHETSKQRIISSCVQLQITKKIQTIPSSIEPKAKQFPSPPPPYSATAQEITLVEPGSPASADWEDVNQAPTDTASYSLEATEAQILSQATAAFAPVPADARLPPLPKPVLIPRLNPGPSVPFARAWPSELENYAITPADFIAFVDNLNVVCVPHAAIRIVEVAALGTGFVPLDWAAGVSAALGAVAILATAAATHQRKKKYLFTMNETYFHPRKLHVKTIGSKKMMHRLGLDKKDPLLVPLTEETLDLSTQERCLEHLSQWSCALSFDVPPPRPQTTLLAKMAQWEVNTKIKKADRESRCSRKRAWEKHQKGKKLKEGSGERLRIKGLSWIYIQNLEDWQADQVEKHRKKEEKRRNSSWRTIVS